MMRLIHAAAAATILLTSACAGSGNGTQIAPAAAPVAASTSVIAPLSVARSAVGAATESAYPNGVAWPIPGTISFDDYDLGGRDVGYHTNTTNNPGGAYRHDGVGIQATTDTLFGNGFNVGWDENANWLRYTVAVAKGATYQVEIRVASLKAAGGVPGSFHLEDEHGTNLTGSVTVPVTGGFQTWASIVTHATLSAGTHVLKMSIDTGHASYNVHAMRFAASTSSPSPSPSPTTKPSPTSAPSPTPKPSSSPTFPPAFWDRSNIPPAKNVMMLKFLNRTNGKYPDSQVFWTVTINGVKQTHSIAEQKLFDMPANASGRVYLSLGTPATGSTNYYDFMEYTIGSTVFNGNTTRVDAFGLKTAMLLHCADGFDVSVGENASTFAEDRATTFARFIAAVPAEFKPLAQLQAPYRILNPGAGGFDKGGAHASYYQSYIDWIWQTNGLTIPKAGPNGSGLGAYPDLSAAIYRHTARPGTFTPSGKLISQSMWKDPATFYTAAPANYYAKFWHDNAISGKAYGFPYDDVGGYSSYISHQNPQYLLIAVGW